MKVEVRPIVIERWHKKSGKDSFARPKKVQALVDVQKNEYATGLTKEDINYLKDRSVIYDLSPAYRKGSPHPFWESSTATVKLDNNTAIFDTDNTIDFIKVKIMKASKYVANSMKEYEEGLYPHASHVIFDEREEVEIAANRIAIKKKAIISCSKLPKEKKLQLLLIINGLNLKGKSDDLIEVELDKLVEKNAKEVLRHLAMDKAELFLHALVLEGLQKSVLRKVGHKILYHDSVLGQDIFEVITYLKLPENQDFKLRVMKSINE